MVGTYPNSLRFLLSCVVLLARLLLSLLLDHQGPVDFVYDAGRVTPSLPRITLVFVRDFALRILDEALEPPRVWPSSDMRVNHSPVLEKRFGAQVASAVREALLGLCAWKDVDGLADHLGDTWAQHGNFIDRRS